MEDKGSTKLVAWLQQSDTFQLSQNIRVIDTKEAGRAVFLQNGKLTENEVVVSVPTTHQLNFYTVLYHISLFNNNIVLDNVTCPIEDRPHLTSTNKNDPRFQAYSVWDTKQLLSLTSFQLLALYCLAEWVLLPQWSGNNDIFKSSWQPFFNVWPTADELSAVPAIWKLTKTNNDLIELLPGDSVKHMNRISNLVETDWDVLLPTINQWYAMFPDTMKMGKTNIFKRFLLIYFAINSRCLYCDIPLRKEFANEGEDVLLSNFTMVPYVDYLNHTDDIDQHCYPKIEKNVRRAQGIGQFMLKVGPHSYTKKGDELMLNYGPHSNDFLLSEYGFVMKKNRWNHLDVTDYIIEQVKDKPSFPKQKQFLEDHLYWGDYTLNNEEISFRTLVAVSLFVTEDERAVEQFIKGFLSENKFLPLIKDFMRDMLFSLLQHYHHQVKILLQIAKKSNGIKLRQWYIDNLLTIYRGYNVMIEEHLEDINS
ncbi:protein-lysine N-methyltransferase KNAG_0A04620 [Huiozyma naganishii CBS 8797]|uniref:SET domain-containing protein n=1 Tax=Huiozyma naganishii (strain ATCC MYA-139 / BCRC 22969 / CBS 8797 / KCTC 17520 / NBRC 10181 / NCYC 3082 / Yp74L-3) TaxID=1071383 RepID=J7S2E6_HUIN7|nr:hypothetical protein KNAG_0A04620 [Kazachstania naganishii CBS 8797]CCK68134.1 hypothetical protein KNAG_0A04620 [Kazachstania naganishii CBS 8797]